MRSFPSLPVVFLGLILFAGTSMAAEPKSAAEAVALGDSLREKEDYTAAVAAYTKAIKLDPKCAKAYTGRGRAYANLDGNSDKAIADLNEAIRLNPKSVWAFEHRSEIFGRKGERTVRMPFVTCGHSTSANPPAGNRSGIRPPTDSTNKSDAHTPLYCLLTPSGTEIRLAVVDGRRSIVDRSCPPCGSNSVVEC